jgi:hypothetical protein
MNFERFVEDNGGDKSGYDLIENNLLLQCMNCVIIGLIALQS